MSNSDDRAKASAGEKATAPRVGPKHLQIDGGWKIQIYKDLSKTDLIAEIIMSTNEEGFTIYSSDGRQSHQPPLNTEMWWVDAAQVANLRGSSIYMSCNAVEDNSATLVSDHFTPFVWSFQSSEVATWSTVSEPGTNTAFKGFIRGTNMRLYLFVAVEGQMVTSVKWVVPGHNPQPESVVPAQGTWESADVPEGEYWLAFSLD